MFYNWTTVYTHYSTRSSIVSYITLQLVGLLGMFDRELLRVTGVVVKFTAVGDVAGLGLTLLGQQELRLVWPYVVVGALLLGLTFVLQVALKLACSQGVNHLGVVLHTAEPHLLALLLQVGLLVAVL